MTLNMILCSKRTDADSWRMTSFGRNYGYTTAGIKELIDKQGENVM